MDLLFLGTSSGTPTRERNVTGLALIDPQVGQWWLVDCGEGTQHRLLQTPLSLHDLQALLITHVHGDHCYGLPGLLASAGMQGRRAPLLIVAPAGIEDWFRATQTLTQLHLPFELQFMATETLQALTSGGWRIDASALSHRVPSYAYRFTEAAVHAVLDTERLRAEGVPRGPLWGQLQKGSDIVVGGKTLRSRDYLRFPYPPRRLVIGGDNDRPELLTEACRAAQLLVHEATYTRAVADRLSDTLGDGRGHSSAAAVAAFAQSIGLPNLVLTHFSARYQAEGPRDRQTEPHADPLSRRSSPSIEDIRAEAAAHYSGTLFLAQDLMRYRLDRSGAMSIV